MSSKMKEEERKRLSGHIRKCLESQKDQEFILQIPLKRGLYLADGAAQQPL